MVLSDETQRVRRHVTGHAELSAKSLVIHSPRPEYLIAPARAAIQHDNVKVRCAARGDRVPCLWRRVPACKGRKEEEENESQSCIRFTRESIDPFCWCSCELRSASLTARLL